MLEISVFSFGKFWSISQMDDKLGIAKYSKHSYNQISAKVNLCKFTYSNENRDGKIMKNK